MPAISTLPRCPSAASTCAMRASRAREQLLGRDEYTGMRVPDPAGERMRAGRRRVGAGAERGAAEHGEKLHHPGAKIAPLHVRFRPEEQANPAGIPRADRDYL